MVGNNLIERVRQYQGFLDKKLVEAQDIHSRNPHLLYDEMEMAYEEARDEFYRIFSELKKE